MNRRTFLAAVSAAMVATGLGLDLPPAPKPVVGVVDFVKAIADVAAGYPTLQIVTENGQGFLSRRYWEDAWELRLTYDVGGRQFFSSAILPLHDVVEGSAGLVRWRGQVEAVFEHAAYLQEFPERAPKFESIA